MFDGIKRRNEWLLLAAIFFGIIGTYNFPFWHGVVWGFTATIFWLLPFLRWMDTR